MRALSVPKGLFIARLRLRRRRGLISPAAEYYFPPERRLAPMGVPNTRRRERGGAAYAPSPTSTGATPASASA